MSESVHNEVGFIGLGNIGKAMALRLAASELPTVVYDVVADPVTELVTAGAHAAESVADLASRCEVICVMVRDDEQVKAVLDQVLGSAGEGTVVLVHSTVRPDTPVSLAELAAPYGVAVLDAPVSGGPMGAAEGTLAVMVGGGEVAFAKARPVLEVLGSKVVLAGEVGSGTKMKLARNLLHFVSFTAATEAQRLAEAAGLDLAALGEVVRHTDAITGGPGAIMLRKTTEPIAEDDFWYGVFSHVVALGEKDLSYATALAHELGVGVPLTELALEHLASGLGLPARG
ncbi:MAG TPA: NAD(P)-dependent oxidoreductase [Marmoricola sp.]|nr:NAD(P)-dependent oxidoreductase [Nocardioidaceae bacterium]MCO5325199.1 NAD(P)-dependent oxidoreductase [Nocardioidaceae bacterium]HMY09936.1 NAD(P)-dependent oxidoreductase [Marmoricola sp.]HRV70076.1 NAD(P)-dependent oxidoreductase [Marmoricola sp.]